MRERRMEVMGTKRRGRYISTKMMGPRLKAFSGVLDSAAQKNCLRHEEKLFFFFF